MSDLSAVSNRANTNGAEHPSGPGPATAEALKRAPEAVKRSMPMALSIALGILLAAAFSWLAHQLVWLLLFFYLSFVAATIAEVPVHFLIQRGLRRTLSAVLVMVGLLTLFAGFVFFLTNALIPQFAALSDNLKKSPQNINALVNGLKHHFPTLEAQLADFDLAAEIAKALPTFGTLLTNALTGLECIALLVLIFFLTLYMLIDGPGHLRALRSLLPKRSRGDATRLFHQLASAHRGWAFASFCNILSAWLLTSLGLSLLGVPAAIILALIAALGELIPNIGPGIAAIPALLVALLTDPHLFPYVALMFILVQTLQGYLISPFMLRFSIRLPVLVTLLSVVVFATLFNFLGILVAIPLVADLVVTWNFLNAYMESDPTDYDNVNTPPSTPAGVTR